MKDTKPMHVNRSAVEPSEWRKTVCCAGVFGMTNTHAGKRQFYSLIVALEPRHCLTVWTTMS